jgi:ABC-2 type transport system ATP-binding protein
VLVSSHLLAEVAQTVDDVVIIAGGRLVMQSSLRAVRGGGGQRWAAPDVGRALLLTAYGLAFGGAGTRSVRNADIR